MRRLFSGSFVYDAHAVKARVSLDNCPWLLGKSTTRGMRPYNEDRMSAHTLRIRDLRGTVRDVFAFSIFDGHGGSSCAEFLAENLDRYVEDIDMTCGRHLYEDFAKKFGGYWRTWRSSYAKYAKLMQKSKFDDFLLRLPMSYLQADFDFLASDSETGSTCTAAYLYTTNPSTPLWDPKAVINVAIAQIGDTRCLLADNLGNVLALTTTHHASSPHESDRLQEFSPLFNSTVGDDKLRFLQYENTRAFGDFQGKQFGISAEPDLMSYRVGDGYGRLSGTDAFLVLVTDGVTDIASDQEIVDSIIHTSNAGGPKRGLPQAAAQELIEFVAKCGTDDNASAMVIRLPGWGSWMHWSDRSANLRTERLRAGPGRRQ